MEYARIECPEYPGEVTRPTQKTTEETPSTILTVEAEERYECRIEDDGKQDEDKEDKDDADDGGGWDHVPSGSEWPTWTRMDCTLPKWTDPARRGRVGQKWPFRPEWAEWTDRARMVRADQNGPFRPEWTFWARLARSGQNGPVGAEWAVSSRTGPDVAQNRPHSGPKTGPHY